MEAKIMKYTSDFLRPILRWNATNIYVKELLIIRSCAIDLIKHIYLSVLTGPRKVFSGSRIWPNRVRDSVNVNGILLPEKRDSPKFGLKSELKRIGKEMLFGITMKEVRHVGLSWKRAGTRDHDHPFQTLFSMLLLQLQTETGNLFQDWEGRSRLTFPWPRCWHNWLEFQWLKPGRSSNTCYRQVLEYWMIHHSRPLRLQT